MVPDSIGALVLNARHPISAQPCLASSARYFQLRPSFEASAQGGRKIGSALGLSLDGQADYYGLVSGPHQAKSLGADTMHEGRKPRME